MASCTYISPLDQWGCPEEGTTGDGLCIFHDPDLTKDVDIFKYRFEKRLAGKTEDPLRFEGSIFPGGIQFAGVIFNRSVYFNRAQFHGQETSFDGTKFHGQRTSFERAQFHSQKETSFERAEFRGQGGTSFDGAQFHSQWTLFDGAQFHSQWTLFDGAQFHSQETSFVAAEFHSQGGTAFDRAEFSSQRTRFDGAEFHGQRTSFDGAEFRGQERTSFDGAQFHGQETSFNGAQFHGQETSFNRAQFLRGKTCFTQAQFLGPETSKTSFREAHFHGDWIKFQETSFRGKSVNFTSCSIRGRTQFTGKQEDGLVFKGVDVDFRKVEIDPLDALSFRDAGFQKCRLLETDLRKVEMTNVSWPKIGSRFGVYDEIVHLTENEVRPLAHIERLYRELKQNYEDRRDYERAGDFHYGEKEMRRQNPRTPRAIKVFLNLYWLVSGYGERFLRPLLCAGVLFVLSTLGYLLLPEESFVGKNPNTTWGEVALYSFQVMTFLKPQTFLLEGLAANAINTIESLLGPLFIGLFALAVRQRLKR